MLTIAPAILSRFASELGDEESADAVRIAVVEKKLDVFVDEVRETDETFEHEGRIVLVLDEVTAALLKDRTLTVEDSEEDMVLRLR